jgi:hypothetical protein
VACNFKEWIDTSISRRDKDYLEWVKKVDEDYLRCERERQEELARRKGEREPEDKEGASDEE